MKKDMSKFWISMKTRKDTSISDGLNKHPIIIRKVLVSLTFMTTSHLKNVISRIIKKTLALNLKTSSKEELILIEPII